MNRGQTLVTISKFNHIFFIVRNRTINVAYLNSYYKNLTIHSYLTI